VIVSLISAVADNGVIGKMNALPWYLPADLKHFKDITMGKPIIMGRTTYESIGRPLPGRINVVLSSRIGFTAPGCVVVHTVAEALQAVREAAEAVVIGGGAIYKEFLPLAEKMYLTEIHREIEGDIYFPKFNRAEWIEEVRQDFGPNDENPYSYSFVVLNRLKVDKSS